MDFYNKQYTAESLDELIQYYAKAVEYYDTIKDEISSYFIFKIQDALATKKSLKILIEHNNKTNINKSITSSPKPSSNLLSAENLLYSGLKPVSEDIDVKNGIITENAMEELSDGEEEDEAVKDFAKKRKAFLEKKNKKVAPSFTTMRNQKQRFVNFFHKMENEKAQQTQDLNILLKNFGSSAVGNDQRIRKDLDTQKERLQALIQERKQKSFATHTLSASSCYNGHNFSSMNIGDNKEFNGGKKFEDVLKELDDNDENNIEVMRLIENGERKESDKEKQNGKEASDKEIENTPKSKKTQLEIPEKNDVNPKNREGAFDLSPIVNKLEIGFDKHSNNDLDSIPSRNIDSNIVQESLEKEKDEQESISLDNSLQNIQEGDKNK